MATAYRPAKCYADDMRAAVKQAQRRAEIDPRWKIEVRVRRSSMCTELSVTVTNAHDEAMVTPVDPAHPHGRRTFTEEACALAGAISRVIEPITGSWANGRTRFVFIYTADGGLLGP